jgi:uncharacterized protein with GYD domain
MATYVILSVVSPEAFGNPKDFRNVAKKVSDLIKKECPDVKWKASYATFGRFDIVDIVESDNPRQVARATAIIRAYGHATTETMEATEWDDFLESL